MVPWPEIGSYRYELALFSLLALFLVVVVAARIIEEPPGTMGRYQFTHALIQETLAQELSTTRRARLHARICQALEELYSTKAQPHAAELAHHFAEAELILGPTKIQMHGLA